MAVTKIEDIKKQAQAQEIELPGWQEGETITVLAKRPSIFMLASTGKIPNSLLSAAQKVFTNKVDDKVNFKDIAQVMEAVAEAALIEPTLSDLYGAGIELTDDQLAALFSFSQGGVKELEKFRPDKSDTADN